jgi:hypothetical protein
MICISYDWPPWTGSLATIGGTATGPMGSIVLAN